MDTDTMAHTCVCGKKFKSGRGMKIHRTKMGCLSSLSSQEQRSDASDKTLDDQSQVNNHSAADTHAPILNRELGEAENSRREKLNLPPANAKDLWEELDEKIVSKLNNSLGKSTLEDKLKKYGDIVYETCKDKIGVSKPKEKKQPQKSRRQLKMEELRVKKKNLRKQIKAASEAERQGLEQIWQDLKIKHSALSKAESARKKKSKRKKLQDRFFKGPFAFARGLFQQPKSGTLSVEKEELEKHLRETYSRPPTDSPLNIPGIQVPPAPSKQFSQQPITLDEMQKVVKKARAKSAPGPNGIPYLLYKKCPKVLAWLHKMLKSAWKNQKISDQWNTADGVYIPKEQDSSSINQFRPISLLNVEGKIFFSVMASRLSTFLLENNYLDVSVQKGGIPGVPGCLEHATMIWDSIQKAKSNRRNLDVVWLDLANAYGSVPHEMIQMSLKAYHVPENIRKMLDRYFGGFTMRFSTKEYTTNWVNLDVGIAMGCAISPILFVLAMEVILKAASDGARPAELGKGYLTPPLKAFMDDTTIICSKEEETRTLLEKLDTIISAAKMQFKPKKSRSLSLRRGKVDDSVKFRIANQTIPTVSEEPVKSLGRWYDATLKDTKRGDETKATSAEGLEKINQCGLPGKFKVWCLQFMLIPKLLWPLLIYDICTSTVEAIEAKINKYTRKWLGLPPCLTDCALYCRQAKLKMPFKSILEEYKAGKARLLSMLEESDDPVVKEANVKLKTGRKWKVDKAVEDAKESLKLKEILGHTQSNRRGLGFTKMEWWSRTKGKAKRDMVIKELRNEEDNKRIQKAVQQSQQGQWTNWENALQRSLSWNDLWHMAPLRISFILRSAYDVLPSNANLVKWGVKDDPSCPLCSGKQTVEHVLSCCKIALSQGRYTWRHNQVLKVLVEAIEFNMAHFRGRQAETALVFRSSGGKSCWPRTRVPLSKSKEDDMASAEDLECIADLPGKGSYPDLIKRTQLRPDIVLHSKAGKTMYLIELTVPYECRIEEAHHYKTEKYADLAKELRASGYKIKVFAVEVGARGFVGSSVYSLMKELGFTSKSLNRTTKALSEAAEKASSWIWSRCNKNKLDKA